MATIHTSTHFSATIHRNKHYTGRSVYGYDVCHANTLTITSSILWGIREAAVVRISTATKGIITVAAVHWLTEKEGKTDHHAIYITLL